MAENIPITLNENNAEDILVTVTTNVPVGDTPFDLAGLTVEAFLKVSAVTADTDSSTWKGSTTTGEVVVTNSTQGELAVSIPGASVGLDKGWWRLDVIATGKRKTAVYGLVTVIAM